MENKREEQMVYLKDLLFAALYKWKTVLVWAVILAVLLGGFKGVVSFTDMQDDEIQSENSAQQELAMEVYKSRRESLKQQIDANRENARYQEEYLEESVLMNLDAYNFYEVYLSVIVETDYQIMPGMAYQNPDMTSAIIHAYLEEIANEDNAKALAETIGTKAEYFRELLATDTPNDTRSFVFRVSVPDEAGGEKLLEAMKQMIQQIQQEVSQTVAPHELRIKEQFTRQAINPALAQTQQEQADKLTALNDAITSLQQQRNTLQPPEKIVASGGTVVKDAVTFAVVGGILGVMLVVLIAWMKHIFGGKIYSGRVLTNRTGIKVFGGVKAKTNRSKSEERLRALEGRNNLPADRQGAMLAYSIAAVMGNEGVLQISGQISGEARAAFVDALRQTASQITVRDEGNLLQDISARQALAQADCVLLVEQCDASAYEGVQQQIDVIAEHGKKLLGCVLIDG